MVGLSIGKATVTLKPRPWQVPNYARVEVTLGSGTVLSEPLHVSEIPRETLEQMCADFRRAVLAKAGYTTPDAEASNG